VMFSGDEVYDEETTSGPISPLDRECDHCGAWTGQPCPPNCPGVWFPPMTGHTGPVEAPTERQRERRGHAFYPSPAEIAALPRFYATEDTPCEEKMLHLHYLFYLDKNPGADKNPDAGCDWWVAEYRPESREAFGYVSLGMPGCAEWGYFSLDELECLNTGGLVVERDLYWTPMAARDAKLPR
jgi:hypothetical protein